MKIISINNNKGGVLKTTIATNIAAALAKDTKVLLLDLDPQGNVCLAFGQNAEQLKSTLSEMLFENHKVKDAVKNLDVLPSNQALNFFEANAYKGKFGKKPSEHLANYIRKIGKDYHYVIIDTAPYMNLLTLASFKVADEIVVPTQTEIFSIKGLVDLVNHIKESETKAKITILPTLFVSNSNLHKEA